MKATLLKTTAFIIMLAATVSCQQGACPAYGKTVNKPMQKTTFLSDAAPKGRY
ncbi:hypothetical protein ABID22_002882 [Pontibacter aydingkolensis]|uniref:Lipoprotein n=1 Tax=Pontibacter aydingkolensis TaxID=1911536 RepID=A0ABS7CXE8_9BACT|nr:hypothetical protein [Pontibacter aydingkolensis]MBW7468465.1 hypothetical protein [Pontibacter aydingkolensis]